MSSLQTVASYKLSRPTPAVPRCAMSFSIVYDLEPLGGVSRL
jgi:hypothetical protein